MRKRGKQKRPQLTERFYYTSQEVCQRFGFSYPRLQKLVAYDNTLPVIHNGRNQLFPKNLMDAWFQSAGARRLNIQEL